MAYKAITLPCISFVFIEIEFMYYHSCVIFAIKSMGIYNNKVNHNEIIIW